MSIAENVAKILSDIEKAAMAVGRDPKEITLCAATKMNDANRVREAIAAGVRCCGENRVQELTAKLAENAYQGSDLHFIGHLQTNKVKYLVGKIALFHSCDRYELAAEISRVSVLRGVVSDVLVQINAGNEDTKGGFSLAEAHEAYAKIKQMPGIRVKGFMAMLPNSDDEGLLAALADEMRRIYDKARSQDDQIEYLSMGMSGDYRLCIEHGSNMIRVGSTIFGERNYAKA